MHFKYHQKKYLCFGACDFAQLGITSACWWEQRYWSFVCSEDSHINPIALRTAKTP